MLPRGCPSWQYTSHADCARLLPNSSAQLLTGIQGGKYPVEQFARDTRPIHFELFSALAPPSYGYYAGNYRGSHHACLKDYEVMIRTDPMVGTKAVAVSSEIQRLGQSVVNSVEQIEAALKALPTPLTAAQRAIAVVRLACAAFVSFLTVHPYADGNGHTARALLWIVLMRFGYVPSDWTIDPRPAFSDYGPMIAQHRRGTRDPLEQHVP